MSWRTTVFGGDPAGTVTLSGSNTFSGGVAWTSRTLRLNSKQALGKGLFGIGGGTAPVTPLTLTAASTLAGSDSLTNAVAINQDFAFTAVSSAQFNGPVTMAATRTITISNGVTLTFSGAFNNSAAGLIKAGGGTLALEGINAFIGPILITAGTMALNSGGSITNTSIISVTNGATFSIGGLNSAFTLGSSQTLSNNASSTGTLNGTNNTGSGTVSVSYVSGTPAFIVTNGGMTLSASTVFKVNNTGAALAVGNYRLIAKASSGNVGQVSGTVPATVTVSGAGTTAAATLQIISGELYLVVGSTTLALTSAANPSGYLNAVNFTAGIRTNGVTAGNVTGSVTFYNGATPFSTNTLVTGIASSASISSLPRGTNTITAIYGGDGNYSASTNSIAQVVTNHAPVAGTVGYYRGPVPTWHIKLVDLATNATDADGDALTITAFGTSTNGITLTTNSSFALYYNTNLINDQFTYTVSDSNGGIATGTVNLTAQAFITGQNATVTVSGSTATVNFAGIPGFNYTAQRSTNLVSWASLLTTNAPAGGLFQVIDNFNDLGVVPSSAYYRLIYNP